MGELENRLFALKEKKESLLKKRDKAQWAMDSALSSLQNDHGLSSVEDAKDRISELQKQYEYQTDELQSIISSIEENYADLLAMDNTNNR
jgi:hypothetical protein